MTEGTEAAADVVTGALVAAAVEPRPAAAGGPAMNATCRNCGAPLAGRYCSSCGQAAHLHRSMASLGHDLLHSVFHFDGKFFRTIPELVLYPGRLTRRYIDGERAKFVSPLALYLFMVFLMYAVFGLAGQSTLQTVPRDVAAGFTAENAPNGAAQQGYRAALEKTRSEIESVEQELADTDLAAERRAELTRRLTQLESSQAAIDAVARGDWNRLDQLGQEAAAGAEPKNIWIRALEEFRDNPSFVAFKLKTNGYKYSWLLVPLSIPFVWLLFARRRDVLLYDHAVFVTYSISFMMMVMIVAALAQAAGVGARIVEQAVPLVAVVHMYRQLRGAYGLSRAGTAVRLVFLLFAAAIVLSIFLTLLLLLGATE